MLMPLTSSLLMVNIFQNFKSRLERLKIFIANHGLWLFCKYFVMSAISI